MQIVNFAYINLQEKKNKNESTNNELTEIGIQKCIEFINNSNIGYLLISGGGEPFLKLSHIFNLIENVKTEEIVIVSNGFWGANLEKALEILNNMEKIQKKRHIKISIK